jgi:hypothetical protein
MNVAPLFRFSTLPYTIDEIVQSRRWKYLKKTLGLWRHGHSARTISPQNGRIVTLFFRKKRLAWNAGLSRMAFLPRLVACLLLLLHLKKRDVSSPRVRLEKCMLWKENKSSSSSWIFICIQASPATSDMKKQRFDELVLIVNLLSHIKTTSVILVSLWSIFLAWRWWLLQMLMSWPLCITVHTI